MFGLPGVPLLAALWALPLAEIQRRLQHRGDYTGHETGVLDLPMRRALAKFAGEFNLEARLRDDDQLSETLIRDLRDLTSEVP